MRYVKYVITILILAMVLYACNGENGIGSDNGESGNGDTGGESGNGDTGDDTGNDPGLTTATFTTVQQEMFTPTCAIAECHDGSYQTPNLSAGVAFNNIVDVQSSQGLDYIEPGNPDNSYLVRKLEGTGIVGLRMPRGATALSAAAIDSVRAWVTDGAPNN